MIISRTPLRISLGGGGTDLPNFYRRHGSGFLVAAAITKYVYIAVHKNFDSDILLKYSEIERVADVQSVRHPLIRECLIFSGVKNGVEISSLADIPAGTGLGSSGAFTVGLLKALHLLNHNPIPNQVLAKQACEIELNRLNEPVGKQDQFISALGGINAFTFKDDETVDVEVLELSPITRSMLEENLLLFNTNVRRSASNILSEEQNTRQSAGLIDKNLLETRDLGYETKKALLDGNLDSFGLALTKQWKLKYARQPSNLHHTIDEWISEGVSAGALGGKLIGAGGGGFLLFYAEEKSRLRKRMEELSLPEVRFGFDYEGSSVIVAK